MILNKLFGFVLGKNTDAIPEPKPKLDSSNAVINTELDEKQSEITKAVNNVGCTNKTEHAVENNEWTICTEDMYDETAARHAISVFFSKNGIVGDASVFYNFLLQFVGKESIGDEHGRMFFRLLNQGLELQKYEAHQAFHDDKGHCRQVYIALADADGIPLNRCTININEKVTWKDISDETGYCKKWFDSCGSVKMTYRTVEIKGCDWRIEKRPVFFVSNLPGCPGHYLLEFINDYF